MASACSCVLPLLLLLVSGALILHGRVQRGEWAPQELHRAAAAALPFAALPGAAQPYAAQLRALSDEHVPEHVWAALETAAGAVREGVERVDEAADACEPLWSAQAEAALFKERAGVAAAAPFALLALALAWLLVPLCRCCCRCCCCCCRTRPTRNGSQGDDAAGKRRRRRRKAADEDVDDGGPHVSVMSYNILNDHYAHGGSHSCPAKYLAWPYRRSRIVQRIEGADCDVVALQEVNADAAAWLSRAVELRGFEAGYVPRVPDGEDGLLLLHRSSLLAPQWAKPRRKRLGGVDADNYLRTLAVRGEPYPPELGSRAQRMYDCLLERDNIAVAQLYTFRRGPKAGTKLLVINVHLFWDPEFALVKSLQAAMVLKWVKELRKSIAKSDAKGAAPATGTGTGAGGDASGGELRRRKGKGAAKGGAGAGGGATHAEAASGVATVVLGDFNSMPEGEYQPASGAYLVMTRAEGLPHTHSEHPRSRHSGGMALRQAPLAGLQPPLASCYRTAHGEEPAFTNFKSDFHGCLDYIFVSDELQVEKVLDLPDETDVRRFGAIPSVEHPSDHLPLASWLRWK